jgi:hypothetical protein
MLLANVAAWIIARYKSVPSIVLRAILADVLGLFDLGSDLYTIQSLFALGHDGPASALLTMVCLNFALQVRAGCVSALPARLGEANRRRGAWPPGPTAPVGLQAVVAAQLFPSS